MAQNKELLEKTRDELKEKKRRLLANEASIDVLVQNFMEFIEAPENNDLEVAQKKVREKALMDVITKMLGSYAAGNNN